jgi:hypothetical protein
MSQFLKIKHSINICHISSFCLENSDYNMYFFSKESIIITRHTLYLIATSWISTLNFLLGFVLYYVVFPTQPQYFELGINSCFHYYYYYYYYYYFYGSWGLNSGHSSKVDALSPEPHIQSILMWLFSRWGLMNYLSRLASNHNSPDLSLPSS